MIQFSNVKKVIDKLGKYVGITIIRADQEGVAPAYPYGTYKIINSQEENYHQNIIVVEENGDIANKKYFGKTRLNISLNFVGKNYDDLYTKIEKAFNFLRVNANYEYVKSLGMTPRVISANIQDRTVYLDTFYEYKLGFDLRLDYIGTFDDPIEAIEHIEITPKPDNVAEQKIIVDL